MSWLRSAMNKAVEVGGNSNLTRAVKSYADTVVHHAGQAVVGGAKILQERMGVRNYKSFKITAKRLEEVAVACRGQERTQILKRWLAALKEIERVSGDSLNGKGLEVHPESNDTGSPRKNAVTVLYYDSDMVDGEPLNFRDVFLHSQALEGLILSMILDPPNEEDVSLLLDIFGFCLTGGKEVHNAVLSSIQDLGKAFSSYEDEVLVKRDELLQFAQGAIAGLKISGDLTRIDFESCAFRQKVDALGSEQSSDTKLESMSDKSTSAAIEALKGALVEVRQCSKLEGLLLKKKSIHVGDSPEIHSQKVDKLKILAESLASSSQKAEKRIADHRTQIEEALNFRVVKDKEVGEIEKELSSEIAMLQKQKEDLQAELKKVNASLSTAMGRLKKTSEEREQFEDASNQIVMHLKSREDELSRSIASCRIEGDVVQTWINFLEDTWLLQCRYSELKDMQLKEKLEKYGKYLVNLTTRHVFACKKELEPEVGRIRSIVDNLEKFDERSGSDAELSNPRGPLEEEYLKSETKIITAFSVVDNMKELFLSGKGNSYRGDCTELEKLLEDVHRMRMDFETIKRPTLDLESPPEREIPHPERKSQVSQSDALHVRETLRSEPLQSPKLPSISLEQHLDAGAELAKLESEFGNITGDYSAEIDGWEFDELERELMSENATANK